VSEHNSDVDRAIAAFGAPHLKYHSFGTFTMRPRTTAEMRAFTYNEFGEPEYSPVIEAADQAAPVQPRPEPLFDPAPAAPVSRQPPMPPVVAPVAPAAVVRPPSTRAPNVAQGGASAPYSRSEQAARMAPPPRPIMPEEVAPVPVAPPPPPFFPLLASALPNATEPSYTPSYQQAPAPSFAQSPVAAEMPAAIGAAAPGASTSAIPGDQRSLNDMFRLLAGRGDAAPAAPAGPGTPVSAAVGEAQALFRRI
jgi:hypothetical protein